MGWLIGSTRWLEDDWARCGVDSNDEIEHGLWTVFSGRVKRSGGVAPEKVDRARDSTWREAVV